MRRVARILLNALTTISLLLLLAAIPLAVRSHWYIDAYEFRDGRGFEGNVPAAAWGWAVISSRGRVRLARSYDEWRWGAGAFGASRTSRWIHERGRADLSYRPRSQQESTRLARYAALGFELVLQDDPDKPQRDGAARRRQYVGWARTLTIPLWAVAAVTAILPAFHLILWRRRRVMQARVARSLCPSCGYDLRATPERCPECGTIPAR